MKSDELLAKLKQEGVLEPAEGCVVALSGGCDSVSLLLLLHKWQEQIGMKLWAVHVNHGLRGETALSDEAFCRDLCGRLNIPLVVFRENIRQFSESRGVSLEEAGRIRRYERLLQTAQKTGIAQVVTAHQQNDQAETLLLHLLRGSGLHGLTGMTARRPLNSEITLVRPLLNISRAELEAFLKEEEQDWREDESNRETQYSRNYIRNSVLPVLEGLRPDPAAALARTASLLTETADYIKKQAHIRAAEGDVCPETDSVLPIKFLEETDKVLRCEILRIWFSSHGGLRDVSEAHFDALNELLYKTSGSAVDLPGGRQVLREQMNLRMIDKKEQIAMQRPRLRIETFPWHQGMKIPDSPYTKWIDYDIIKDNLCLRTRLPGDYLILKNGGKKLLSRLMVDEKIPLSERNRIWVLAQDSHVLWVVGHRLSAAARITEKTVTVAQITVEEAGEEEWKNTL